MFTIAQLYDKQKLQLWQSCNYFFYQKLQLLAKEVVTFFNLSKFVSKEAFLG